MNSVSTMNTKIYSVLGQIENKYHVRAKYVEKCEEIVSMMGKTGENIQLSVQICSMYCILSNIEIAKILNSNLVFTDNYCKVIGVSSNYDIARNSYIISFIIKKCPLKKSVE